MELKSHLQWNKPDEEPLREFLIKDKMFHESRIDRGIKSLMANRGKNNQVRLDAFFKSAPPTNTNQNSG